MAYRNLIASDAIPKPGMTNSNDRVADTTAAQSATFNVPSMHCSGCMNKLESGLRKHADIISARANLSARQISVTWSNRNYGNETIARFISKLGYENHPAELAHEGEDTVEKRGSQLLICLSVAGFASANIMLLSVSIWSGTDAETTRLFSLISGLIAVPAVIYSGRPFYISALGALKAKRLNMDVPISLAVLLSLFMSFYETLFGSGEVFFEAGVMLLFFLLIGRTLDHFMREKALNGVKNLMRMQPASVNLINSLGTLTIVPIDKVKIGDQLRILPGDRFPVDVRIVQGTSNVDRSIVSGESNPLLITRNDVIEAGALNLDGVLVVEAQSTSKDSFLAEVKSMMAAAENGRSKYRRIADRMADIYAPTVHLVAFLAFAAWIVLTSDFHLSLTIAVAVLIITCPCALGLAVPISHVAAANRLFEEGILMRDGSALERLAEVDQVMFDKTGTLTSDKLTLKNPPVIPGPEERLLVALAQSSKHPSARAIANHFRQPLKKVREKISEVPGFGLEARINGRLTRLGRPGWADEFASQSQVNSTDTILFAIEEGTAYGFQTQSTLRPGAVQSVQLLRDLGLPSQIISGDRAENVAAISKQTGIVNWRAELTPQDKIATVETAHKNNCRVLMVGDGLNDAPCLVAAHVSMSPGSAADVSRSSSDFVLTRCELAGVGFTLSLARKTAQIVKQNFALAISYNCVAVPLAITGHVTPLFAAVAMSASSIVVVLNATRLLFHNPIQTDRSGHNEQGLRFSSPYHQTTTRVGG